MPRANFSGKRRRHTSAGATGIAKLYLATVRDTLERYLPRIVTCLGELGEKNLWWRPNSTSNSAGNLTLHLCGNIRQWIISGLGGAPDVRVRDAEFAERGPLSCRVLVRRLESTVGEALGVLRRLPPAALTRRYEIQGYCVTGLYAAFQVAEHFSHHAGQIIYIAKLKRARDLGFTKLPKTSKRLDHI